MTLTAAFIAIAAALVGAVVGGLLGLRAVHTADRLQQDREARQRESDRKLLAGALAAEARGISAGWRRTIQAKPDGKGRKVLLGGRQALCPVFDGAGYRLPLLPAEVVDETVTCYHHAKSVSEWLQTERTLFTQALLMGEARQRELENILVERSTTISAPRMEAAISQMESLAEKPEAIAEDC